MFVRWVAGVDYIDKAMYTPQGGNRVYQTPGVIDERLPQFLFVLLQYFY